jgi:ATP:ADP antiporter, AAA family
MFRLFHYCATAADIISELYSSVSVGVLFWQFANEVTPVEQAKRFYPLLRLSISAPY